MRRLATTALASVALAVPLAAAAVESKDPIKLTIHDWTGQYITTNIMGAVLDEMGYNVEYVQADYIAQFAGLEAGDLHVAMENVGDHRQGCHGGVARDRQDGRSGRDRHGRDRGVVVPDVHEGEVSRTSGLEGAQRVRGGVLHPGDASEGSLSRRPGHVGRLRRRAGRCAGSRLRGRARRHRRGALRRTRVRGPAPGAQSCVWIYTPHWAPIKYEGEWVDFPRYNRRVLRGSEVGHEP